ncbi:MAG: hypothetical protein ACWGSD_11085 [Thermodesulfobacteriota bacterium]
MSEQFWEREPLPECSDCRSYEAEIRTLEAERDELRKQVKSLQKMGMTDERRARKAEAERDELKATVERWVEEADRHAGTAQYALSKLEAVRGDEKI